MPTSQLILALDVPTLDDACALVERVGDAIGMAKVGLELFVRTGPEAVTRVRALGLPVFLDLKLHDIPETVDRAVASACGLGATLLTVHASGGPRMLERAQARAEREDTGLAIVAVTVLTSHDSSSLTAIGINESPETHATRLADVASSSGIGAFVCSPYEVRSLRKRLGDSVTLITPGVRAPGQAHGDQARVMTPREAVLSGATWLVVGRPIRDATEPRAAALALLEDARGTR